MEMERYRLIRDEGELDYLFYSFGPRGRVMKIVQFQPVTEFGKNVFNIAFGDFDEFTGRMNDNVISNNGDRLIILRTVASAIADFIAQRPDAIILAKGSTLSRVRLYQMAISSSWSIINQEYEIYGKTKEEWIPFQKGMNFEEFLLFKKIK